MAYTHKLNRGSIFKNDKKSSDQHPDMTGSANIGGVEYWVSAWRNEGKDGKKANVALSFKEKDDAVDQTPPPEQPANGSAKDGDGLPF